MSSSPTLSPADPTSPTSRPRRDLSELAPLLTLAALVLFFGLSTRNFFSLHTLERVLSQASVLAIVSVGLTFVLICGEIDLSVGMVALWTACQCGVLWESAWVASLGAVGRFEDSWFPVLVVILLPLLNSILLGLVSGSLTVLSRLPSFIMTLAMMNIAVGLSRYLTRSQKFTVPPVLDRIGNNTLSLGGDLGIPYSALLAAVVLLVGHVILQHTRFGRYVYMTGGNREAARLAGVRTQSVVIACLGISAFTAGLGGLVNAGRLGAVTLDQNANLLLDSVACVVLGGTSLFGGEGGMRHTLLGVFTYQVLYYGLNQISWIDDLMRPFLLGVVLMISLVMNGLIKRRR